MLFNLIAKLKFSFRKNNKKNIKKSKLSLKRFNLNSNLLHIKNHNELYKGKSLMTTIVNRQANVSKKSSKLYISRFESFKSLNFYGTNTTQGKIITNLLDSLVNVKYTIRFKKLTFLYIQDLMLTYKS